jgi:hypothetical protein
MIKKNKFFKSVCVERNKREPMVNHNELPSCFLLHLLNIQGGRKKMKQTNNHIVITGIILLVSFMFTGKVMDAKKIGSMPEIAMPHQIIVNNGLLYVSDSKQAKVQLYSVKDFKYLRQVSGKGEAPGETLRVPLTTAYPDYIFLYSFGKGLYFSKDGKYIKEFRVIKRGNDLLPIGENFLFTVFKGDDKSRCQDSSIYSYSKETDLKFIKNIYIEKLPPITYTGSKMDHCLIRGFVDYTVYDDKIFLGDSTKGLYMEIFDKYGNRTGKINFNQFEKLKVTGQYKKDFMERAKISPDYNMATTMYNIYFPEYYPGFYRFEVDKGKVYFLTYNKKGDRREMVIADWTGKLLKQAYVPWVDNDVYKNFSIENNKFYYVVENEATENWDLHVEDIR